VFLDYYEHCSDFVNGVLKNHMELTLDAKQSETPTVLTRRVPKQQRSREKYERVLTAARTLIADRGNDNVSMREIADAASLPIGSVYQYFPDKNAVLWTLISGHFDELETDFMDRLERGRDVNELGAASLHLFDQFVRLCGSDPCFSRLWRSVQANNVLAELDKALNERIADAFHAKLITLGVSDPDNRHWTSSYLMAMLSSTALQLAFSEPERQDQLLDEFRKLLKSQFLVEV
jgi:AcrR family transcriptional regulator